MNLPTFSPSPLAEMPAPARVPTPRGRWFESVFLDRLFIGAAILVYLFALAYVLTTIFVHHNLPQEYPLFGLMPLGVRLLIPSCRGQAGRGAGQVDPPDQGHQTGNGTDLANPEAENHCANH